MRYLKEGLRGPDVATWASFIRGLRVCSELIVTDVFTSQLKEETVIFQRSVGLTPDGTVGPLTMAEAMKVGFNPMIDEADEELGPNWPPRPDDLEPLSLESRMKVFGRFAFVPAPSPGNAEGIRIVDDWVSKNIERVVVPQLIGVYGAPKAGKIDFNRQASKQLSALFQAWEDAGLMHLVLSYAGSWVPRYIRGSRSVLSNHAWGTAFDINAPWNALGAQGALKGQHGSVRELVSLANQHGFFWGGHYKGRPDAMHFEVAKLL